MRNVLQEHARETAGRRVECARETTLRRADGDLRDLTERLEEERERFKSQLGAAHAEILRLSAEVSRLEKRRNYEHLERKETGLRRTMVGCGGAAGGGASRLSAGIIGGVDCPGGEGAGAESFSDRPTKHGGARKRRAAEADEDGDCSGLVGDVDEERALRREVEEEREALQRMCNGLAVDLKDAVEATSEAKEEREALVQVADAVIRELVDTSAACVYHRLWMRASDVSEQSGLSWRRDFCFVG